MPPPAVAIHPLTEFPLWGPQQGPSPPLAGYYAMKARNLADGAHSVLDFRNVLAAEFGPVPVEKVTEFFEAGVKAGLYTMVERGRGKGSRVAG
jgi:hypothetical protein